MGGLTRLRYGSGWHFYYFRLPQELVLLRYEHEQSLMKDLGIWMWKTYPFIWCLVFKCSTDDIVKDYLTWSALGGKSDGKLYCIYYTPRGDELKRREDGVYIYFWKYLLTCALI